MKGPRTIRAWVRPIGTFRRLSCRPGGRVLAGVGLGVVVGLAGCSSSVQEKLQEYEEVAGHRLGEVLMESVEGDGPILVLRSPSDPSSTEPTASRYRGLRKACPGRVMIQAGPDPRGLGPPTDDFQVLAGEDWADQITAWCGQYPDAAAVVSLLFEFPPLENAPASDLPPFFGFTAGPSQEWARAMRAGTLRAVVRYKPGVGQRQTPARGASPGEIFDLRFKVVTPESFGAARDGGGP